MSIVKNMAGILGAVLLVSGCNWVSEGEEERQRQREYEGRQTAEQYRQMMARCRSDDACGNAEYCHNRGNEEIVCRPRIKAGGQTCSRGRECVNNSCTGSTCDACTTHEQCQSWLGTPNTYCSAGECHAKRDPGSSCTDNFECRSTLGCVAGSCGDCTVDADCAHGFHCSTHGQNRGGSCNPAKAFGQACSRDRECNLNCDGTTGTCRSCAVKADCGTAATLFCENGACLDRCDTESAEVSFRMEPYEKLPEDLHHQPYRATANLVSTHSYGRVSWHFQWCRESVPDMRLIECYRDNQGGNPSSRVRWGKSNNHLLRLEAIEAYVTLQGGGQCKWSWGRFRQ